jgi:hypothetical protein
MMPRADTNDAAMGASEKKSLGPSWYEAEAPYARYCKMKEPQPELVVGPRLLRAVVSSLSARPITKL